VFTNAESPQPFPFPQFPATLRTRTTSPGDPKMDPIIAALAKAAGLDKALADFPADIEAAAAQALGHADAVQYPNL
jgi:hypothetical protein